MQRHDQFYVVGVGTSAGGLEPLQHFFDCIPNYQPACFVIVQHLSPDFESMMEELLSRYTQMQVSIAQHHAVLEPNHIYLIPKKKLLEVQGGRFVLSDKKSDVVNFPIDVFFHSLGMAFKERSIGIILSGSGTDGSRGVNTIHQEGGVVIVQDAQSAQFDSMPNATIAASLPDFVGSPTDIAEYLTGILQINLDHFSNHESIKLTRTAFYQILNHVHVKIGVDFGKYKPATLTRKAQKRLQVLGLTTLSEYQDYLLNNEYETELLFNEFLIGVTSFFRDTVAFDVFQTKVLADLFKGDPDTPIRVWVVGCSTGEEAYSLAMMLYHYKKQYNISKDFKVFATDINKDAIHQAGKGLFNASIEQTVPKLFLHTYFHQIDDSFQIINEIREKVVFVRHDILRDPPFTNIDLISCRNLLIYIDSYAQSKIIDKFSYVLNENGVLFLGASEALHSKESEFEAIDHRWRLFKVKQSYEKQSSGDLLFARKELLRPQEFSRLMLPSKKTYAPTVKAAAVRPEYSEVVMEHYAPFCLVTNQELNILYMVGELHELFKSPKSRSEFNLKSIASKEQIGILVNGINTALNHDKVVDYKEVPFKKKDKAYKLDIRFIPKWHDETQERLVLIEFLAKQSIEVEKITEYFTKDRHIEKQIEALEIELKETKQQLDLVSENYEATNDELQATNEELMSSNEEMQSTNEEMQSVNEELFTVNAELQAKIDEITTLNNDMNNLLAATDIGTVFLDSELKVRKFTPAIKQQFKLVQNDIGRPIDHFKSQFGFDNFKENIQSVLQYRQPIQTEIISENGRHFLMKINPFISGYQELKGVVISFVDIQDLKKVEAKLEAVVTSLDDIIFEVDEYFTVLNLWTSQENSFYNRKEEIIGENITSIYPEAIAMEFERAINSVLISKKPAELIYEDCHNGAWYKIAINHLNGLMDQAKRVSILVKNITDEKLAEEKLKESNAKLTSTNQYLDTFVHTAAHDLKSPIVNLKNLYELFGLETDDELKMKMLGMMSTAMNRLDDTVESLIQIIDTQKNDDLSHEDLSFDDILHMVMNQLQHKIDEASTQIEVTFQATQIQYNKAYLTSVFQNLISNAIKYRKNFEPPRIHISTKQADEFILLSISDNGIGMDLKQYGHLLFKPFKRLTTEKEGKGIGLNIVKNMVEKNGGKIEVESILGGGTTFNIYLKPYPVEKEVELANP